VLKAMVGLLVESGVVVNVIFVEIVSSDKLGYKSEEGIAK